MWIGRASAGLSLVIATASACSEPERRPDPPFDGATSRTDGGVGTDTACVTISETYTTPPGDPAPPPSSRVRWTTDAAHRLAVKEMDFDADGAFDMRVDYQYDSSGRLTREEDRTPVDAPIARIVSYTYDGDTMTKAVDDDADGTVDVRELHRYEHDAAGHVTLEEIDSSADGTLDYRYEHEYDPSGRQVASRITTLSDGTVQHITRSFDADGRITRLEIRWEQPLLGEVRVDVTTIAYDDTGARIVLEQDLYDDGAIDARVVVTSMGCDAPSIGLI